MKWAKAEQPPVSVAASFSVEGFEWSYHWLSATSSNRGIQSANAVLEEYKDSSTTQKEDAC